ncbi:class I SAM-dependent methyltransferase [Hyphococcus luteus]|uniref:SAM-dependent methyltransferase n=1 Tax=Hyphococcus luteus TaxID=2058213 RepID=A0A2S7JZ52_9PROT|nr:class I SAM-dependent methyltransferase [Marinicaulis flavus]PQA85522.1 SAM-dependent methyltransferase [Marinicaulis flavus]
MTAPNEAKLEELAGKVIGDIAGATGVLMAYLGDQAGVYDAMDGEGPMTSETLAKKTGLNERYLREWLSVNAAAGYVDYDAKNETFALSPEQATIFGREGQPMCMQGFFQAIVSQFESHEKIVDTFKSGKGRPWSDQPPCCFCATDRFFRPGYAAHLMDAWIPSLTGVKDKLEAGGSVADIGCGYGSSTILMAKTFPNSTFTGFDFHEPSVEKAREEAAKEGVANVKFEVASAKDFPGSDYDLACIFDALHDMGDPVGAAAHIRETLSPDGVFMLVEPMAGDKLEENLHPLGRIFYGFSTTACVPASLAQEVGLGLGAQAGEKRLTQVLNEAGFTKVRRASETPTNMVLEARA